MTIATSTKASWPNAGTSARGRSRAGAGRARSALLKVGGRVVYRLEDVESYEATQLRHRDRERAHEGVTST